jgi:uncharacterized protein YjbJ (UPF0337 family)
MINQNTKNETKGMVHEAKGKIKERATGHESRRP